LFVDFYQNYNNSAANKEQKLLNLVFCQPQLKKNICKILMDWKTETVKNTFSLKNIAGFLLALSFLDFVELLSLK